MSLNIKTLVSLIALCALSITTANAAKSDAYYYDIHGDYVKTIEGKCWRSIHWTPATAIPACEGDADADGVLNEKDKCADTPAGSDVDATGCVIEKDQDNDGVLDKNDKCSSTPAGTAVDSTGCALIGDADNDGVKDNLDQCSNTEQGISVDSRGCPKDSDNDGVYDSRDACPNTPIGTPTNLRGCELKASLDLSSIQFKTGTAALSSASKTELGIIANTLVSNAHLKFEVAGHTDNTGNLSRNIALSQRRAESVKKYLGSQGVTSNRLTAKGYGPGKPLVSNKSASGRAKNRRVELILK